ncbi:NAD(P)/FAD-dependent oxidoreductase [Aeoliella sp. SH292]|uniref:NAD(P)/FAD-dependent oxidoreductase n=1 Tax=Aeoliella sp. SH292 TaxID=3454464 RepID=UPI003F97107F
MKVVIVGGGFGGLNAALGLRRADCEVTLVDRENYHLFQPLLYQVATGSLSPANICAPLRSVLKRQKNATVLQGEVVDFDVANKELVLEDRRVPFDTLIVAAGMTHSYFGKDAWAQVAPGLKSIAEATEIRARILSAFELAEWETDDEKRKKMLTFVVVGGGPTGVELAGTLADLARHTLPKEFRNIDTASTRVVLVDAAPHVLAAFPEDLSVKAREALEKLGVEVHTGLKVSAIDTDGVTLTTDDWEQRIEAGTVLWAAGVKASPLGAKLAAATGAEVDRGGRVMVEPDLSIKNHPNVFVVGDLASLVNGNGKPIPGVAPAAIQEGKYVAKLLRNRIAGKETPVFHYRDLGSLATIGRAAAVAKLGRLKFTGIFAWWLWLLIHLMQLVEFENRILVLMQWTWSYVTRGRSARLITVRPHKPT